MISLKFDLASRSYRSVVGVTIQYIRNWKIVTRTIALITLNEGAKSHRIKTTIDEVMAKMGLEVRQIHSLTTD